MSNIVPIDRLPAAFREDVQGMESQFAAALPPQIPVERFMRVVMTAVNSDPALLSCDKASLFEAAVKAAQDGLLPDKRDGAFVIFKGKVQWMPMVGGILKKVRNSGELKSIAAHVVYSGDQFTYELGDEERIEHKPNLFGDRGEPIAVYAVAKTKDGGIYREIMSTKDVEKVRSVSRAKDSGPWVQWWDEMARKTAIRRLAKRLPMSSDLDDIIRRDDEMYDLQRPAANREPSGFAARIALNAQDQIAGPREGFDQNFIDAELGARPEVPVETDSAISTEPEAPEPATHETPLIDPDTPASQLEEPPFDEATRNKLASYTRDLFGRATSDKVPDDRLVDLKKTQERWRIEFGSMPDAVKQVAGSIWKSAQAINRGDAGVTAAASFLADAMGVDEAALLPTVAA